MANQENDNSNISVNANSSANAGNSNTDKNGVLPGDSNLQRPEEFEKDNNHDPFGDTALNKGLEAQAKDEEEA